MLSMEKNKISIVHYKEITYVSDSCIQVELEDRHLRIDGKNLHLIALEKEELLLEGCIEGLVFRYGK